MTAIKFDSNMHVSLIQSMANDENVVMAARISTSGASASPEVFKGTGKPLINYLMKNRHGTPFEHGMFTFRVTVPIFVMRELHRHRIGFSYNEESGRYHELEPHFYVPAACRNLVQKGRPGHYGYVPGTAKQHDIVVGVLTASCQDAWLDYQILLEQGIAREVARMVLPVNIYSSCYVTCNPRSLMAFLSLRTINKEARYPSKPMHEIANMAFQMEQPFRELMPITYQAFNENGRVAP